METIGQILLVSLFGMGTVFIFLVLLYLLMILVKVNIFNFFNRRILIKPSTLEEKNSQKITYESKNIQWLIAALVAFLETESQITTPTAIPWKHNNTQEKVSWKIINQIKRNGLY